MAELAELISWIRRQLARVIVEPVSRLRSGSHDCRAYLHVLRELCLTHDVLLVFDEIAEGSADQRIVRRADDAGRPT